MSLLAPLFLFGALAVALPVLFHLIRRTTRERTAFSSLMFLQPSPPRLTRRSRLEHILLLLLRCAVICLLALGFARPFLKSAVSPEPSSNQPRRILVLVDTSASMRRADLWPEARARVDAILRKTSPVDQVALFTFNRDLTALVTFEEWNATPAGDRAALAAQKLASVSPGSSATQLGTALIRGAETLADTSGKPFLGPQQIVLISDLQEGSRLEQLQGYEWPKELELSIEALKPRRLGNASLQLVTTPDEADPKTTTSIRVRVSNTADSKKEQFKIGWAQKDGHSFLGKPIDFYVPPGQSRTAPLPVPSSDTPVDRIILVGDEEEFDNTVFVVPPEQTRLTVLYFGADAENNPRESLYFLQRAFQQTRKQAVQLLNRTANQPLLPAETQSASLLIVTSPLSEERARDLHQNVTAGKTLLFSLGSEGAAATLARLLGVEHLAVEEAHPTSYAMLAEIDFRHPLFSSFADPRFNDFTKIHFWKYRRLEATSIPGAHILAKFDNGDPAMLEVPVGKGRVMVLTSGWHPDDSQLALSTKFVPLLYSLLEQSATSLPIASQYHVGDIVPIASLAGPPRGPVKIITPAGLELNLAISDTNFSRTTDPGIYRLASAEPAKRFAVNMDPAESRIAPLAVDELERLGVPVTRQVPVAVHEARRKIHLQNAELENRQKLWRVVIIAAMAVLVLESWLAGRAARRNTFQTQAVT